MSYIKHIAEQIYEACGEDLPYPEHEAPLWLGYAVLALILGSGTVSRDVHEVWSAWASAHHNDSHRSLVPFGQLSPEIQSYDDHYRDAIRSVSEFIGPEYC